MNPPPVEIGRWEKGGENDKEKDESEEREKNVINLRRKDGGKVESKREKGKKEKELISEVVGNFTHLIQAYSQWEILIERMRKSILNEKFSFGNNGNCCCSQFEEIPVWNFSDFGWE